MKLEIEKSSDILLANSYHNVNLIEHSQFISDDAKKQMLNHNCVFIHSPTGSGKTTTINYLLNNYQSKNQDISICCITSRRTMISSYDNAIKLKNILNQPITFDNYLINKNSLDYYYISSLEFLPYIKRYYRVIVLDEITSLIRHYYSETMNGKRYKSLVNLINLIQNADYIICADAIMTDFCFKLFDNLSIKYFYYRNEFKNCVGKNMIIYKSLLYDTNNEIARFLKGAKSDIKENKSVIIFSDSKEITETVFLILQKYNNYLPYYMIINRDSTDLETITNCNQTFINKCVIISPKIIYSVDIQIQYSNVYCIYKNTNKMNGMSSIEYHQQINRCRQAKNIHVLFLNQSKFNVSNHYVPFECFCEFENKRYQSYKNEINKINKKYDLVDEMCSTIDMNGSVKISDTIFTPIHYLKSWYDDIFTRNKIQLIELLAKESGYNIVYKKLEGKSDIKNSDINKATKQLKIDKSNETKTIASSIVKNQDLDKIKNKVLLEQLLIRAKVLKINECKNIEDILSDEKKYNTFINRKYLDLSLDEFYKFKATSDKEEISIIKKDDKLIKKIELVFWLENLVGINRFDINAIKINDVELVKTKLSEKVNELIMLSDGANSKIRLLKFYQNKIDKIENNNDIQSFIADCYNSFGNIIEIENKQIRNKDTKERLYIKTFNLIKY